MRGPAEGPPAFDPWLVALAPAMLLALVRRPWTRQPLALAAGFLVVLGLLVPYPRYAFPAVPMLMLVVAVGLDELLAAVAWIGRQRWAVVGALAALAAPGLLYGAYHLSRLGPVPASDTEREAFLLRQVPGYGAVATLNRLRGADYTAYALLGESLRYHAKGRLIGDHVGPDRYSVVVPDRRDPAAIAERLRRLGAGYLIWMASDAGPHPPPQQLLAAGFRRLYTDPKVALYEVPPGR